MLQVAACVGPYFDEELIEHALGHPATLALKAATAGGLLLHDNGRGVYMFQSDRIQQAAYAVIVECDRESFHLEIGRRLWKRLDVIGVDKHLYTILSQLRLGIHLIT